MIYPISVLLQNRENIVVTLPPDSSVRKYFKMEDTFYTTADGNSDDAGVAGTGEDFPTEGGSFLSSGPCPQDLFDNVTETADEEDVYTCLAQKENDLLLAAQLGKALLDENAELQRKQSFLHSDYTDKIESLNQEKHALKQKLDRINQEYDSRLHELQHDISVLRVKLVEQQTITKQLEKDKQQTLNDLMEQNSVLVDQLDKATGSEKSLSSEVQTLKSEVSNKKNSMYEHIEHLDLLKNQIQLLSDKRGDLERKIGDLSTGREVLVSTLAESDNRIHQLERANRDHTAKDIQQQAEMNDIRTTNLKLHEELQQLREQAYLTAVIGPSQQASLLSEMSMSVEDDDLDAVFSDHLHRSRRHLSSCDFEEDMDIIPSDSPTGRSSKQNLIDVENLALKQEILEVYRQLRRMLRDLCSEHGEPSLSNVERNVINVKAGNLTRVLSDLRTLMQDIMNKHFNELSQEENPVVHHIDSECCRDTGRFKEQIHLQQLQLDSTTAELSTVMTKLNEYEQELVELRNERDRLLKERQVHNNNNSIRLLELERDDALQRRTLLEEDLAKAKLDMIQLDTQLMGAIQQKIRLSQQVDQWQHDMHVLLDNQVKNRLGADEKDVTRPTGSSTPKSANRKRFSLFQ